MDYQFREATQSEIPAIWEVLQQAIARRKADGSQQWQDGYPNPEVVKTDIEKGVGFVLADGERIIGYAAVLVNDEPAYAHIRGEWLTNSDFLVVHRVAISEDYIGQGLAKKIMECIELLARSRGIYSIKADTNFDNIPMMKTFEKLGYVLCGEVFFRNSPRKAYEKVLVKADTMN